MAKGRTDTGDSVAITEPVGTESDPTTTTSDPAATTSEPTEPAGTPAADDTAERLAAAEAELAAFRAAEADRQRQAEEANTSAQELLQRRNAENEELRSRVAAYEKAETKRVTDLKARNKARAAELPKALQGLVPSGLEPDALAEWIDRAAKTAAGAASGARGNPPGRPGGAPSLSRAAESWGKSKGFDLDDPEQAAEVGRLYRKYFEAGGSAGVVN